MGYTSPKISVVSAAKCPGGGSGRHCLLEISFSKKSSKVSNSYCGIICAVNGLGYGVGQKVKVSKLKSEHKGICIGMNNQPGGGWS